MKMVENSQKSVINEGMPRHRNILIEKLDPILDMQEVIKENNSRREAEEIAKKQKEEFVKQTLYQQSLKLQESMQGLQKNVLGAALGVVGLANLGIENLELGQPVASPNQAAATKNFQFKPKDLKPLEKSASTAHILKKKTIMEEGIAKNFHVDYTGKMIYFDNQK